MDQQYFTCEEAAEYLRVSVGHIRNMKVAGKIECCQSGEFGMIRFTKEQLDKYARGEQSASTTNIESE